MCVCVCIYMSIFLYFKNPSKTLARVPNYNCKSSELFPAGATK